MLTPPSLTRREFGRLALAGSAALSLGTLTQAVAAAPATTPVPEKGWIDAHVHVWTPDTKAYPLDKNFTVESMKPASFTPEELFAHSKPAGVKRIVLIQMSFYQYDNSYMLDMMAKYPGVFSGVGIVDHQAKGVAKQMKALAEQGVRGFRLHSHGDDAARWVSDPGMAKVWKTAQKEDLAVCPLINPQDVQHIDALCQKFPETRVVIDHFARIGVSGKFDPQPLDALCKLARFPNVYVKTSAFYALGKKQPPYKDLLPLIQRVVEAFGADRLMWASDCPYQVQGPHSYEESIALIRDHSPFLSESERHSLLCGTADKVFFS